MRLHVCTSAGIAALALLFGNQQVNAARPGDPTPTGILVAFRASERLQTRLDAVNRAGLEADTRFKSRFIARLKLPKTAPATAARLKAALRRLREDPTVRIAELDYPRQLALTPNDARFEDQYALHNTGQGGGTVDADIDLPEAWERGTSAPDVIVADVDTGIDLDHEDLEPNLLRDNQDRVIGYDFANDDANPADDHGHGTHTAGTIGARGNNRLGVAGVCHVVKLMPIKAFDETGNAEVATLIQAVDFARENGARIINASYTSPEPSVLEQESVARARDAGILFVAAAGNQGEDFNTLPKFPAGYHDELENVIAVGATASNDTLAGFSNFGNRIDLAAPGVSVLSTTRNGGYGQMSGTSMATPHVAGTAALILGRFPSLTPLQIKRRLLCGVDEIAALHGQVATGRLNADKATEVDTTPPAAPSALSLTHHGEDALRIAFTAPGDDGLTGTACDYEIRYSTEPITEGNFPLALAVENVPKPSPAGLRDAVLIEGLETDTDYFVAIRAIDNASNVGRIATGGPFRTLGGISEDTFSDNAEGLPRFVGEGSWAVTTETSHSRTHSYTDSPGASYSPDSDTSLTQSNVAEVSGLAPELRFWLRTDLESPFDKLHVEVSTDRGGSWARIGTYGGRKPWHEERLSLAPFSGTAVKVRFRLITDELGNQDGVWIDDIRVRTLINPVVLLQDDVESAPRFHGQDTWAVSTERANSPTHAYSDSPGAPYAENADSSLTQDAGVLAANTLPLLSFWAAYDLEQDFDVLNVEVSGDDGETWDKALVLTGENAGSFHSVTLTQYLGKTLKVRFRLLTDNSQVRDGVWIDDIRLSGPRLEAVGAVNPPVPPSNLTAELSKGDDALLQWQDNSNNETAFRLERSDEGGDFLPVAQLAANVTSYLDEDLEPSHHYRYRVIALNDAGESTPSNVAEVVVETPEGGRISVAKRLNFGSVRRGRTKSERLLIRNRGNSQALTVRVQDPAAPFSLKENNSPYVIDPGKSVVLNVRFTPERKGRASGEIVLESSDPDRAAVRVRLTGRGTGSSR